LIDPSNITFCSWVKNVNKARNCDLLTNTENFRQNSATNFRQKINFPQNKGFPASNFAFLDKYFPSRQFSDSPKFRKDCNYGAIPALPLTSQNATALDIFMSKITFPNA